jgi:type IV fimbrial biogenesis protein FimT
MMSSKAARRFACRPAAHTPFPGIDGFSVVELMVAVGIAAILAAVAVPSFSNAMASHRAKAAASELLSTLVRARSEAVMRNVSVKLSPKPGGWNNGWQIIDPANAANVLDDRGAAGVVIINGPNNVVYRASGRVTAGTAPSFVVTTTTGSTTIYQCVSVDLTGRPYMKAAPSC